MNQVDDQQQSTQKRHFRAFAPALSLAPALLFFAVFTVVPALGNLLLSLTDYNGNILDMRWIGLDNYRRAFTLELTHLGTTARTTIVFGVGVMILQNLAALAVALMLDFKSRLVPVYRTIIFLPSIMSVIIVGLIWRLVLDPSSGPVNSVFGVFGAASPLLGSPDLALLLLILVQVWQYTGYAAVIYSIGLASIPNEIFQAAHLDGADGRAQLFKITLPLLRSAITVNVVLTLIGALNSYDLIVVLTNGGPIEATTTLPFYIFRIITGGSTIVVRSGTMSYAASLQVTQFLVILLLSTIALRLLRSKEIQL